MRLIPSFIFMIILYSNITYATIYKWKDSKGTVHFSDNEYKVKNFQPLPQRVDIDKIEKNNKYKVRITEFNDSFLEEFLKDITLARDLAYDCLMQTKTKGLIDRSCIFLLTYHKELQPSIKIFKENRYKFTLQQKPIALKIIELADQTADLLNKVEELVDVDNLNVD